MYSVAITHKKTGAVVGQIPVSLRGQNYTSSPTEYHALAWRAAIDDELVAADADKDDYAFEIVPVSIRDVFSPGRWRPRAPAKQLDKCEAAK